MLSTKTREHIRRWAAAHMPRVCALACVLGTLGVTLGLVAGHMRVVDLSDTDGAQTRVITISQTLNTIYPRVGIAPPGQYDEVEITHTRLGEARCILRAFGVPVTADGTTTTVISTGETVAELLREAGLTWDGDDIVSPAPGDASEEGDAITLQRVEYREYTQQEVIPIQTEYIYTSLYWRARFRDLQTPVREGSEGLDNVTYRERWVDGVLAETTEVSRQSVTAMVPALVKVYGEKAPVSRLLGPEVVDGAPVAGVAAVYSGGRCTGYSSSRDVPRGASGRRLVYGTVSVDPKKIPYGSLLYIRSDSGNFVYGYAYAADTGGALTSGRALVDLFYETREEAIQNEVMSVTVYVIDKETAALYKEQNQAIMDADDIVGR